MSATEIAFFLAQAADTIDANGAGPINPRRFCVQDLFFEANAIMDALLAAIADDEKTPGKWIDDPGFALTQGNLGERAQDMWGYRLLMEKTSRGNP